MSMLPERLHARIRHQLSLAEPDLEARALAAELAELGQRARERLEQCATLLRLGNEQAALRAAEAEPSLPDLCATVSFAGSPEWARLCQKHGLAVTPAPDDAHVVAVELLYGKPIDENHPLYRDYRQAIRERDDARALAVLRSITNANPGDANAQAELKRVRAKFMHDSLAKVGQLFATGRDEEATQLMGRMEQLGVATILDDPAWSSATARRAEWLHAQARSRLSEQVRRAAAAQAAGDWRACADAVGLARTIERNSGVEVAAGESPGLAECEQWAAVRVAEEAAETRVRGEGEALRADWAQLSTEAARGANASVLRRLNRWRERARVASDRLGPELLAAADELARSLHGRVVRRHTVRTAGGVAVLLALVLAGRVAYQASLAESALTQALATIDEPLGAWNYEETERRLAEAAKLATTAELLAEYRRRESEARATIQSHQAVERALAAEAALLAEARGTGVDARNFADIARRSRALESALAKVGAAAERRTRALSGDLAGLIARCESVRQGIRGEVEQLSAKLEAAAGAEETLADAGQADALVRRLLEILNAAGVADAVGDETRDRALALAERVRQRLEMQRAREGALRRLDDAADLRAYLAAIATLSSEDAGTADRTASARVAEGAESLSTLPRGLLGPRLGAMWDAAGTPEPNPFVPNAEELAVLARLGDDSLLRGLRKYQVRRHESPEPGVGTTTNQEQVFIVGKPVAETRRLAEGTETLYVANVLRSAGDTEERRWSLRRFSNGVTSGHEPVELMPLPEVNYHGRLTRFLGLVGGHLAESPLRTLERVRKESGAQLLRAYHLQELFRLAAVRPAESGLAFSPSAQRDREELRGITQDRLRWTEFAFKDTAPEADINRFMARSTVAYAAEAAFHRAWVDAMRRGGVVLVGRAGRDGRPVWRSRPPAGTVVMGLDSEGRAAALLEIGADGSVNTLANPAPLSPLVRLGVAPADAVDSVGPRPAEIPVPPGGWNQLLKGKDL